MPARTLVIGDIHGCDVALDTLLARLPIGADDTVVLLGDVVSRGPATKQCIDRLLDLKKTCRLIYIRGNHEEMMLDSLQHGKLEQIWLKHGGMQALASYGGGYGSIPPEHIEFLNSSIDLWQTDDEIFVHANLEPAVPLEEQTGEWLRWVRFIGFEEPHSSGKRVICGHTPQPDGAPAVIEGWVCLDTWAYNGSYLSALDTETNIVYQAKQTGEFRECPLSEFKQSDSD
jgi:serine/threonine protein phosphatase 1